MPTNYSAALFLLCVPGSGTVRPGMMILEMKTIGMNIGVHRLQPYASPNELWYVYNFLVMLLSTVSVEAALPPHRTS